MLTSRRTSVGGHRKRHTSGESVVNRREIAKRFFLREYVRDKRKGLRPQSSAVVRTIETLSTLPQVARVDNLLYVVMPVGAGKTFMSHKYGFLDIDACVKGSDLDNLPLALEIVRNVGDDVKQASREWLSAVRRTISCFKFDTPTIILVHDDMTGYMSGGSRAGSADVDIRLKRKKLLGSKKERRRLLELTTDIYQEQDPDHEVNTFADYELMESHILGIAKKYGVKHAAWRSASVLSSDVEDASLVELESGCDAGLIGRDFVAKEVRRRDPHGRWRYAIGLNAWAYGLCTPFIRSEIRQASFDKAEFMLSANTLQHPDVIKIINSVKDDSLGHRIAWWECAGMDADDPEYMLRLAMYLPTNAAASISYMMTNTDVILGHRCSSADRAIIAELCWLLGGAGRIRKLTTTDDEHTIERMRVANKDGSMWITESARVLSNYMLWDEVDTMSTKQVAGRMEGWTAWQGMVLLDTCMTSPRRFGKFSPEVIDRMCKDAMDKINGCDDKVKEAMLVPIRGGHLDMVLAEGGLDGLLDKLLVERWIAIFKSSLVLARSKEFGVDEWFSM